MVFLSVISAELNKPKASFDEEYESSKESDASRAAHEES